MLYGFNIVVFALNYNSITINLFFGFYSGQIKMPITTLAALKKGQTKTGSNSTSEDCNSGNEEIFTFYCTVYPHIFYKGSSLGMW